MVAVYDNVALARKLQDCSKFMRNAKSHGAKQDIFLHGGGPEPTEQNSEQQSDIKLTQAHLRIRDPQNKL